MTVAREPRSPPRAGFLLAQILAACLAGGLALHVAGCATYCSSPAAQTAQAMARDGVDAKRDMRLVACARGDWITSVKVVSG